MAPLRPLSILDLSPVTTGNSGPQALRNSIDLARHADRLGFSRYWVAEHHNMPNIASSAPDIMIGQIAAVTERLRVGSGGVMLPNHAPLQVAERYKVLEGLFPGRIDLGLGRAPGTDPVTSYALRRRQDDPAGDDFLDRFQELLAVRAARLSGKPSVPQGHAPCRPTCRCRRSSCSARAATARSSPPMSARASRSRITSPTSIRSGRCSAIASSTSRRSSGPSRTPSSRVHVVCADTDAEAERLASSVDLNFALRRQGRYQPIPSPEEAAAHSYSPTDRALVAQNRARLVVGGKDKVMAHLEPLIEATKADEVMVTTMIYDHEARKHSYELLAEAFGLSKTS